MGNLLIPENDLQELWELSGRVKAVLVWLEKEGKYAEGSVVAAMLGMPMQTDTDEEPKDVFSRIGISPKPKTEETEEGSTENGND